MLKQINRLSKNTFTGHSLNKMTKQKQEGTEGTNIQFGADALRNGWIFLWISSASFTETSWREMADSQHQSDFNSDRIQIQLIQETRRHSEFEAECW